MIDGVLQIDKPKAESSASHIRKLSKIDSNLKIGHCGTLDPMATGLLIVCLNQMTRFASYLSSSEKTYQAWIFFGQKTNTGDSEGEIIESKRFSFLDISTEEIEKRIKKFEGKSNQRPPAFSALKYKGKSLYEYARKGIKIDKDEREIFISSIKLISVMKNELNIEVSKSETYLNEPISVEFKLLFNPKASACLLKNFTLIE